MVCTVHIFRAKMEDSALQTPARHRYPSPIEYSHVIRCDISGGSRQDGIGCFIKCVDEPPLFKASWTTGRSGACREFEDQYEEGSCYLDIICTTYYNKILWLWDLLQGLARNRYHTNKCLPGANIQTPDASHDAVISHTLTLSVVTAEKIPRYLGTWKERRPRNIHQMEAPMASTTNLFS